MSGAASYRPILRELRNLAAPSWWVRPPGGPRKVLGLVSVLVHNVWLRCSEPMRRRLGGTARVSCPVCGFEGHAFLVGLRSNWRVRPGTKCPQCHSRQRHRFLRLLLADRYGIVEWRGPLLHFSPRGCLPRFCLPADGIQYVGADLDPSGADLCLDITALPFADGSVPHIICSHVLEHVPDHLSALAELRRVLSPGGIGFIAVPLFGETTTEFGRADPQLHDHVRAYGRDFGELLRQYFHVTAHEVSAEYDQSAVERYGLLPGEVVYACRHKPLEEACTSGAQG